MCGLDDVTQAHIEWLGRVMHALQSDQDIADLCRETADQCCFGRWLVDQAVAQDLAAIDGIHRAMHEMAMELLRHRRKDEDYYVALDRFCNTAIDFNRMVAAIAAPRRSRIAVPPGQRWTGQHGTHP
jgi:hypothetical protein